MARTALTIVGQAVGGYFFGPVGAAVGGTLGGIVGNLVDPIHLQGPRIGDLNIRASTYGRAIPLVYGAQNRVGGNLIWSTGLIEHRKTEGSSLEGTKRTTYTYRASVALAICEGPARQLNAIYANGIKIWGREDNIAALPKFRERYQHEILRTIDISSDDPFAVPDFLEFYNEALLFPEFTPWVCSKNVTVDSNGRGLYAGEVDGCFLMGAKFNRLEWWPGTNTQRTSYTIEENEEHTPAYRNVAYVVIRNLQLAQFGNTIPMFEFEISGQREETVATVVGDICRRSGLQLHEAVPRAVLGRFPIRGYAVSTANSAAAALVPLVGAYPFDANENGGTIRFAPRQRGPVVTLPEKDLAARPANDDPKSALKIERAPDHELVFESAVTYIDPDTSFLPNTQIALRAGGYAKTKLSQQLPLTLSSDEARGVADRALWESWLSRHVYEFCLPPSYDWIQAGDTVAIPVISGMALVRIVDRTRGDNGIIEIRALLEDRLAYEGAEVGAGRIITPPTLTFPTEIVGYVLNAPAVIPAEDDEGFLVALNAVEWSGGSMYRSTDGAETFESVYSTTVPNVTGSVTGSFGAGPTDIWDRENVIEVELDNPDDVLESLPEETILAGQHNLVWIGAADGSSGELIQFADAEETSIPGRYLLSNLLRGRRGTEYAVGTHSTDEIAVFLPTTSIGSLNFSAADWNLERSYRPVANLQEVEDLAFYIPFVATGERLAPRSVVHGAGTRDGSNNLTVTWVRRSRLFPPAMGYGPVPLEEWDEQYEVEVLSGATVKRTETVTSPSFSYSAANQTADGFTQGNPITVRIYQMSAVRGRGHPATFTV